MQELVRPGQPFNSNIDVGILVKLLGSEQRAPLIDSSGIELFPDHSDNAFRISTRLFVKLASSICPLHFPVAKILRSKAVVEGVGHTGC